MTIHMVVIGYVIVARMGELLLAHRHTRRLRARGGFEVGRGHYPLIVVLHLAWLACLAILIPTDTPPDQYVLAAFAVVQVGRFWVLRSLGERWTTRIIVVPGDPLVQRGPYRWCRHPNYLVVCAEIALLPLAFGAWQIALLFSFLNAVLLAHRIKTEQRALSTA